MSLHPSLTHHRNINHSRIKCEGYIFFIKKCARSFIEVRKLCLIMFPLIFVLRLYNSKVRHKSLSSTWSQGGSGGERNWQTHRHQRSLLFWMFVFIWPLCHGQSATQSVYQSLVVSYQRLYKWYLIPPCLTLSNIRYVSEGESWS